MVTELLVALDFFSNLISSHHFSCINDHHLDFNWVIRSPLEGHHGTCWNMKKSSTAKGHLSASAKWGLYKPAPLTLLDLQDSPTPREDPWLGDVWSMNIYIYRLYIEYILVWLHKFTSSDRIWSYHIGNYLKIGDAFCDLAEFQDIPSIEGLAASPCVSGNPNPCMSPLIPWTRTSKRWMNSCTSMGSVHWQRDNMKQKKGSGDLWSLQNFTWKAEISQDKSETDS